MRKAREAREAEEMEKRKKTKNHAAMLEIIKTGRIL